MSIINSLDDLRRISFVESVLNSGSPAQSVANTDGTPVGQAYKIDNVNDSINAGLNPLTTQLIPYSAQISTNATTTPTSSTAYISSITINVTAAGTTSNITIKDKQGTPLTLVNSLGTTAVTTGLATYNFQTPQKMTSGIDIITTGSAAATISIFMTYYQ